MDSSIYRKTGRQAINVRLRRGRFPPYRECEKALGRCQHGFLAHPAEYLHWIEMAANLFLIKVPSFSVGGNSIDDQQRWALSQRNSDCTIACRPSKLLRIRPRLQDQRARHRQGDHRQTGQSDRFQDWAESEPSRLSSIRTMRSMPAPTTCRAPLAPGGASMVKPAVLQELMRHASINTTMACYVDLDADELGDDFGGFTRPDPRRSPTDSPTGAKNLPGNRNGPRRTIDGSR